MSNEIKMVKCPCCGGTVFKAKFCVECGSPLENAEELSDEEIKALNEKKKAAEEAAGADSGEFPYGFVPMGVPFPGAFIEGDPNVPAEEEEAVDDSGLTLLVDYCRKTVATVGGDGYDETVLYKNEEDGSLQIHTYSKYVYMPKESHRSYKAKDGAEEAAYALIDELKLADCDGKQGAGLCGGVYVCKFLKDGKIVRISTDNMGMDGPGKIMSVGNLLGSYIGDKLVKEK